MTNPDLTLIGILVDRSGSMVPIRRDMEGGINTLLKDQLKEPGKCEVTIAQFDHHYEVVTELTDVANVSDYSLVPRGTTALNDAIGKFVTDIGATLAARAEADRPSKVVIAIVTDGYENASREWTTDAVKKLVTQQQDEYNWQFLFLGKDIDAFDVATRIGVDASNSMDFSNIPMAMAATSANLSAYRASGDADFLAYSSKQRQEANRDTI